MPRNTRAARAARDLLKRFGSTIPVDVESIAKSLSVGVRYGKLDDDTSGMLVIKDGNPLIGVNSRHHANRQRFTIAHELCHFLLHKDQASLFLDKSPVFFRDNVSSQGSRIIEIEANDFAAELLMPDDKIHECILEYPIDMFDEVKVRLMAERFGVSPQALLIRLTKLGYVMT